MIRKSGWPVFPKDHAQSTDRAETIRTNTSSRSISSEVLAYVFGASSPRSIRERLRGTLAARPFLSVIRLTTVPPRSGWRGRVAPATGDYGADSIPLSAPFLPSRQMPARSARLVHSSSSPVQNRGLVPHRRYLTDGKMDPGRANRLVLSVGGGERLIGGCRAGDRRRGAFETADRGAFSRLRTAIAASGSLRAWPIFLPGLVSAGDSACRR